MPRELVNAVITHVSYVDKAANKKRFFLTKSEEKPNFQKEVKVLTKADDVQKLVYGIVYEPDVLDSHDDMMTAAEIEKSAHLFMEQYQTMDLQHNFEDNGYGTVVESYVAPADFAVGDSVITKGSWVLVTKASDEVWESIQKGEITGYSMGGTAETIAKSYEEPVVEPDRESLFQMIKKFFAPVEKGEVLDKFDAAQRNRDLWTAHDLFDNVFYETLWADKPDVDRLRTAASDFITLVERILINTDITKAEEVLKAGRKISGKRLNEIKQAHEQLGKLIAEVDGEGEGTDVTKEEMLAVMKEAMAPVSERLEALEKAAAEPAVEPEVDPAAEEVAKAEKAALVESFKEVLKAELAPVVDRVEAIEKARAVAKGDESTNSTTVTKSVWDGLL
jgi:hypothetical protein